MLYADGFNDCLIGEDSKGRAVYDADKILDTLVLRDDMTRDEAVEYFWFNIDGAYVGEETPLYVFLNYER